MSLSSKRAAAFVFALVFSLVAAGCHNNNLNSGFGIGWFTVTDEPGDFAAYIVTIDSVVLTGKLNGAVTVVDIPEVVDFSKLTNIAELWASASIPNDTYTQATITLDYTAATIAVVVNGAPQQATVVDSTGAAPTTITVTVNLDPINLAYSIPTYATTAAIRLALDFDLAASNTVNLATSPATVTVNPYFTIATSASDQKPIRVRGPLVNTSLNEETYSVYVRPFFDEVNTAGTLTLFNSTTTADAYSPGCPQTSAVYTINGTAYVGNAAITQLSETSAGSTMTAAYTTYVPTVTPSATAALFCTQYMIGGSTLEDFYTDGLEGDVIARNGNTLTVRGPTLNPTDVSATTGTDVVDFYTADAQVIIGTGTLVTQDDSANDTGLSYKSVSVGQHIIARGIYSLVNNVVTVDSTGTSSTNTGSIRLQSTQMFGSLLSTAAGTLEMNLTSINQYPASVYNFAGTGTSAAADAVPASYLVNTASLAVPTDLAVGGPVWVDGIVGPYGSAPPDFNALDVEDEVGEPATLLVTYTPSTLNNAAAFATLTGAGLSLNLGDNLLVSAQIRIGAEIIDLTTLPATPLIVPQLVPPPPLPVTVPTLNLPLSAAPAAFLPLFSYGSSANGIYCFNKFSQFVSLLQSGFNNVATPASMSAIDARGTYNRATNTFTATALNVVLD
jgi:hypothetical protein